jgi:HK97 family phage major capsid protein
MTALKSTDVVTAATIEDKIVTAVEKASVFQTISSYKQLSRDGVVINEYGQSLGKFVGEGESKPVNNPSFKEFSMKPFKVAKIVYITTELKDDQKEIERAILVEAAGTLGRTFDAAVLGQIANTPAGFDELTGAAGTVTISDYATFVDATAPVKGKAVSHIVLNRELLTTLKRAMNGFGQPALTITATHINDIPYVLLDSIADEDSESPTFGTVVPTGFVGPFATRAIWGSIPGSVKIKMSEDATINDNGVLVNLWQENKVAYLVEASYGFRVYDQSEFRKLEA